MIELLNIARACNEGVEIPNILEALTAIRNASDSGVCLINCSVSYQKDTKGNKDVNGKTREYARLAYSAAITVPA
jgi:hypothetical protein